MIVVLCVVIMSASMIKGPFWALATEMLPVSISALAIGQINSLNNLGVFGATYAIGAIREATGSFTFAMLPFVAVCGIAGLVALWIGRARLREAAAAGDAGAEPRDGGLTAGVIPAIAGCAPCRRNGWISCSARSCRPWQGQPSWQGGRPASAR